MSTYIDFILKQCLLQEKKGELCLSLCYRPTSEKLTLVPIEATGLVLPLGEECGK